VHDHASYYFLHLVHYFYLSVSSLHIAIDHVEQGREEPPKPAPVKDTNPEKDKESLGVSYHIP
jgi:hypothetical protein